MPAAAIARRQTHHESLRPQIRRGNRRHEILGRQSHRAPNPHHDRPLPLPHRRR